MASGTIRIGNDYANSNAIGMWAAISTATYAPITIYISKIIHFAYNSFNYNTVSKRIIVGTALRRCPVSRGYTQRAEPPLEGGSDYPCLKFKCLLFLERYIWGED